jgi:hypothetical protein
VTLVPLGTVDPDGGVELFTTLRTTTGFVTVDEQCGDVHGPVVIVAVFTTVVVSVGFTTASNVAFAESPLASVTLMTSVVPVTLTEQVSPLATVAQAGVLDSVTLPGSGSVTVALPEAVPTLSTRTL